MWTGLSKCSIIALYQGLFRVVVLRNLCPTTNPPHSSTFSFLVRLEFKIGVDFK